MADEVKQSAFTNGTWTWDNTEHVLAFVSRDIEKTGAPGERKLKTKAEAQKTGLHIRFKGAIDSLEQAQFRRLYQRRIRPYEPKVVTIQDVKDVAIFMAYPTDLQPEFIDFLHTETMDEFLRALIIYFHYYFQVMVYLNGAREEAKRKLRTPMTLDEDNEIMANLSDLRSMAGRNYSYVILGLGDTTRYYHMNNRNSLSDKDRHIYESLYSILPRIVWIAMQRKLFPFIEMEINRLFRTNVFSPVYRKAKDAKSVIVQTNPEEDRVFLGRAHAFEKKLKQRSPAVQELILDDHDYKLLAIGESHIEPYNERLEFLEKAYEAPEECFFELEIGMGILGMQRSDFTSILVPIETAHKKLAIPQYQMPPIPVWVEARPTQTIPENPCIYMETEQTKRSRKAQCHVWKNYISANS